MFILVYFVHTERRRILRRESLYLRLRRRLHELWSSAFLDFDLIWSWASDRILDDRSFLLLFCLDSSAILPAITWHAILKRENEFRKKSFKTWNQMYENRFVWTFEKILTAYFFMIWSTSFESFTISTRNSIMYDATYKIRVKLLHLLTPKTDKSSIFFKVLNYSWKLFWIVALSKFGGKLFWAGNSKICYQNTEKFLSKQNYKKVNFQEFVKLKWYSNSSY